MYPTQGFSDLPFNGTSPMATHQRHTYLSHLSEKNVLETYIVIKRHLTLIENMFYVFSVLLLPRLGILKLPLFPVNS